jgi:hypothetical protein
MSAINFKNGDEVQISNESVYRDQGYQGGEKMRGVISPNTGGWYTVTWDNGHQNSYRDEDLEPYGATKSSHSFELNERVIVCEDGFGFGKSEVGKEFIIVEFGDYGGDLGVKLRDAETNTIHPNSHFNDFVGIKSIKKMESQTETQRKFKVGDKVTYKYQKDLLGSCYRYGGPCQGGYVGTIKSIERDDSLNVTTESGLVYHMSPDEFVEYDGVVIKPTDEAFLEEANRRYPIGTLYKELNDVGEVTGALREASEESMWVVRGESIEVGYGYVYANGRWADVVPETKYVVTQRIPSISGGIYDSTPERTDISAAVIRNAWVDPSIKQLPDTQAPIIMSRSESKNKIKVL